MPPPPAARTQEPGRQRLPTRVPGLRWARMSGFLEELLGEKLVTGGGEEVDVHSLSARGISLLGLYFGCSLSAPCAQLSVSLAAFYGRLLGDAAAGPGAGAGPGPGAGAAAEPDPRRRLEIVFVSSDQDQRQWQDFVRDMPWLALPYKEKHRKVSGEGLVGAPDLAEQPARPRERRLQRSQPTHPTATPPAWGYRDNSSVPLPGRARGAKFDTPALRDQARGLRSREPSPHMLGSLT
ncbi:Nucleoredoxin [Galemys pyrenaicus]|uniref:Nucleoredoxin n=1 Tax=Galemys pyrenaicus TaxID=202257 RepID=A0A8J6AIP7_GALPY|nr:Nucleoredoxin [Galemys pyrenaicus]